MTSSDPRILVTGATGFLGSHLMPLLKAKYPKSEIVAVGQDGGGLTRLEDTEKLLAKARPDIVVHLAAYSGGIGANRAYPADFYFRNIMFVSNMFEAAARAKISKLVYPMGGCSYPATATSPIDESQMWQGFPQPDSAAYSSAKKMGIVAAQAYRTQYGLNSTVIVPGNMYGEYDNYRTNESHVVPGLIRRFIEARDSNQSEVVVWGSGNAERDFVYAGDVAALIPWFMENDSETGPINLSSGTRTSVRELAETVHELTKCTAKLIFDSSKPEGQKVKIFAVDRMQGHGLSCPTTLRDGLARTIAWYEANYRTGGGCIRL
ncbi:MAG: NAD-dependent epimerase/dehydratase family protein [Alphaproteobacteria bacterium]|nr:NAD-dependent epimerase/dehydratase family protein [Alphaproteobacteria bacterium]